MSLSLGDLNAKFFPKSLCSRGLSLCFYYFNLVSKEYEFELGLDDELRWDFQHHAMPTRVIISLRKDFSQ